MKWSPIPTREKEKFLYDHGGKLAIELGLKNTIAGAPSKIMKNFYACEDCHSAFKLISEIVKSEIVCIIITNSMFQRWFLFIKIYISVSF